MIVGGRRIDSLSLLFLFVPVALLLRFTTGESGAVWTFVTAGLAILPLAGWMGRATEHLSTRVGPGAGGLLNATFGNAAELIIALIALSRGLHEVVRASITGSIVGNILLVLGLSIVAGGIRHREQKFNRTAAQLSGSLLFLSAAALVIPAVFHLVGPAVSAHPSAPSGQDFSITEHHLSLAIAGVLFVAYALSLIFSLVTHRHLYDGGHGEAAEEAWTLRRSIVVLLAATAGTALMAEVLVGAVEQTANVLGLTHLFVGVILIAIVGNAAEHSTAIIMARKNHMDLALNIAIGSSIQIALFVAPVLVFASYLTARPLDLLFHPLEVVAVTISVLIVNQVASDGRSHWMEGVLLLAVYVILGIGFFFLPEVAGTH